MFYVSVLILFGVAFYFTKEAGLFDAVNSPGNGLFDLLTKPTLLLLIIPAAWLTRFSANNHHQLFQLRAHYQHKFSLAMSVVGFKENAPEYAEQIVFGTFSGLLSNPADSLTRKGAVADHPNPFMNQILDRVGINAKGQQSKEKEKEK